MRHIGAFHAGLAGLARRRENDAGGANQIDRIESRPQHSTSVRLRGTFRPRGRRGKPSTSGGMTAGGDCFRETSRRQAGSRTERRTDRRTDGRTWSSQFSQAGTWSMRAVHLADATPGSSALELPPQGSNDEGYLIRSLNAVPRRRRRHVVRSGISRLFEGVGDWPRSGNIEIPLLSAVTVRKFDDPLHILRVARTGGVILGVRLAQGVSLQGQGRCVAVCVRSKYA